MGKGTKDDLCWRRAQLAARIIVRQRAGRLTSRDRRLGAWLKRDPSVTNRLIDQALAALSATAALSAPQLPR